MKNIQKLLIIFLILWVTYAISFYLEYSYGKSGSPFNGVLLSTCFSVGIISLVIMAYLESKKFGYVVLILSTYIILAPVFAMEVLNFNENLEQNKKWFSQRYSPQTFKIEFILFYPLILLFYLLFFSYRNGNSIQLIKNNYTSIQKVIS